MRPKAIVCLSLTSTDRLQLINAPESLKKCLKESVRSGYTYGLVNEYRYGDDYEIKLKGRPWNSFVFEENANAKRMVLEIVRNFSFLGYQIYNTANMTGSVSCMFFIARTPWQMRGIEYFMFSLNESDKIRIIGANEHTLTTVENALNDNWDGGFEEKLNFGSTAQYQLPGSPWAFKLSSVAKSRILICKLLENLSKAGWRVTTCMSLSQRIADKGVFIMRSCVTYNIVHCSISLNHNNRLQLINVTDDDRRSIETIVKQFGVRKIYEDSSGLSTSGYKLKGDPWIGNQNGRKNEHLMARCMMCHILKAMVDGSWKLIASTDMCPRFSSSGFRGQDESVLNPFGLVHNWFFVKMDNVAKARRIEERKESIRMQCAADVLL